MSLARVDLAVFAYGGVTSEVLHAVTGEYHDMLRAGVSVLLRSDHHGDALVSRARSATFSRFVRGDGRPDGPADVLLLLDRDVVFRPGDLLALARKADAAGAVLGGLYSARAEGAGWSSRSGSMTWHTGADELHAAEFLAAGCMAIPRAAATKLIGASLPAALALTRCRLHDVEGWDAFRSVVADLRGEPAYLPEDWSFSLRCREAGVPLYLWSGVVLGHVGQKVYAVRDGVALPGPGGAKDH